MACTHGHVTQGCMQQCDYGARVRTLYSLRKRGLLDTLDRPTPLGMMVWRDAYVPEVG